MCECCTVKFILLASRRNAVILSELKGWSRGMHPRDRVVANSPSPPLLRRDDALLNSTRVSLQHPSPIGRGGKFFVGFGLGSAESKPHTPSGSEAEAIHAVGSTDTGTAVIQGTPHPLDAVLDYS